MVKGDPKKPKGKISAYSFFVQTFHENRRKRFLKFLSCRIFKRVFRKMEKNMSGKEKSKFDKMTKADKLQYIREMKDYGPAKGGGRDPNAPKRPPSDFFLFCSEFHQKTKSSNPGIFIGDVIKKLGEMWNNLDDSEKQSHYNKAANLKEKYKQDVADYNYKGKLASAKGTVKTSWKKVVEEEKEDEEDDDE
ncbi:high mobility group protein B3-like [Trichosurus vulpecula]|uniref:high mobility group protein B3-like n=1 Tax=Trichosurus vulpecula TaxID=9337 RepID=UPI00186B41EB|nr:high mobility group protein B3-like [Trichosurus vulpecula]